MKRQANALTSVLENWQDVENAIDIYANSAGSALRENEIYLDSWEAKSKALSAAWNEFVTTFLDSNWIKGFLTAGREVLEWFTKAGGIIPVVAGLLTGALFSSILVVDGGIKKLTISFSALNLVSGGLPILIGLATTAITSVAFWGASASDTAKQIENLTNKIEEQQKTIDDLNAKEKEATDLYKEYASLMSKSNAYGLSTEEKESLLKISNDLVDTYGLEVEGIDAVTGAYIIGANAINDYVEALRKERNAKLEEQTDTRNKRIKKNIEKSKSLQHTSDTYESDIKNYEEYISKFEDIIREYQDVDQSNMSVSEKSSLYQVLSQDLQNKAKSLGIGQDIANSVFRYLTNSDMSSDLAKTSVELNGVVNSIARDLLDNIKVDNADILDSSGESLLTQLLTPYLTTVDWDKFDQNDFETKIKEFATQASSGLSEVATKLQDSQKKITSGEMNLSGYEDMYITLQNKAGLLKQMLDQGIIDQKSYKEQVSQIYSQVANNIGLSMVEIASQIGETDKQSQEKFKNVSDSFISLENQFRQGTISSVEYLTKLTETIENMDFTETFGNNTASAQQFFATLSTKSANILQDTITQFESGKISVKDYGDQLKEFAKQQKALAKNAIEEAKALGITGDKLKELETEYNNNSAAIDDAVKKWEELDSINDYLDKNIDVLRTTTNVASKEYQSFATGLYNEFTKLSDEMQAQIIADMNTMSGLANITAENLSAEMLKSTTASQGLAQATVNATNNVFKNLANNGGRVLTALGNAIKGFNYSIKFEPKVTGYMEESATIADNDTIGGKLINKLIKFKLPKIDFGIKGDGSGDSNLLELGSSISDFGTSLSSASQFIDMSHYGKSLGGKTPSGSSSMPPGSKENNGSGSDSKDDTPFDDNYYSTVEAWLKENEKEINKLVKEQETLNRQFENTLESGNKERAEILRSKLAENAKIQKDILHRQNEAHRITKNNLLTALYEVAPELSGQSWEEISEVDLTNIDNKLNNAVELAKDDDKDQAKLTHNKFKGIIDDIRAIDDIINENSASWWEIDENSMGYWQSLIDFQDDYSNEWIDNQKAFDKLSDEEELAAYGRMINNNKEFQKQILADTSLSEDAKLDLIKETNDKIIEIEKNAYELRKDIFDKATDFGSSYWDSKSTLLQSYFDATNSIAEAQHEITKELEASKTMYEYLNEDTRKLLFNQEDYNILSSKLLGIQEEANALQDRYNSDILTATAENLDEITSKYEMQYETLMKSYEIAKADLEIAKKKQKLNNVLNERNVRMLINGQWTWVANTQDVIDAQNELAEAEYERNNARLQLEQTNSMNALTAQQDKLKTTISQFDRGVITLNDAVGRCVDIFGVLPTAIQNALSNMSGMSVSGGSHSSSSSYGDYRGGGSGGLSADYVSWAKAQMDANSAAWHGASPSKKTALEKANQSLGAAIGSTYDSASGTWKHKYATGTKHTLPGSALMGEIEPEMYIDKNGYLIPINQPTLFNDIGAGGIVFNQAQMENMRSLWDLSNVNTSNISSVLTDRVATKNHGGDTISVGDIIVNNPQNFNEFVREVTNAFKRRTVN